MNFYSPVSNTRCHSIGHKIRIATIKIQVESQGRWERAWGGKAILKRWVLSLERNIGREDEFWVSGRLFTKNRKIEKLRCPYVCVEIFLTWYLQSFRSVSNA